MAARKTAAFLTQASDAATSPKPKAAKEMSAAEKDMISEGNPNTGEPGAARARPVSGRGVSKEPAPWINVADLAMPSAGASDGEHGKFGRLSVGEMELNHEELSELHWQRGCRVAGVSWEEGLGLAFLRRPDADCRESRAGISPRELNRLSRAAEGRPS